MFADEKFDSVYRSLGIKDFMDYASSSDLQNQLLPIKIVFILFSALFLWAVLYFYFNSTYLRYQFLQDVTEFFSWQSYGLRGFAKRWKRIIKKTETGNENDYRLAVMEADELVHHILKERGYTGRNFDEMISGVSKKLLPNIEDVVAAHNVRNTIVHDTDYTLDLETTKKLLSDYDKAIRSLSMG